MRDPSPRERAVIAAGVAVAATATLILTTLLYGRDVNPAWHDEFAYATQIRMLAELRLWLPPHPVGEFFETFYVLHEPQYAPLYFPGTAMLYVPSVWLGIPLWVAEAVVGGVTVGLFYLVAAELLSGGLALLGAFVLLSLQGFQLLAVMTMAQVPMLLLGLAIVWAFLRWRARRTIRWALLIGALAGWALITRPLDALCYSLPVAVAMSWESRGDRISRIVCTAATVVVASVPFLALQAAFNVGVTGSLWTTPWQYYVERNMPGGGIGFTKFDPSWRVASELPQKLVFYDRVVKPYLIERDLAHAGSDAYERVVSLLKTTLPHWSLVVLVLLGLLGSMDRQRWLLPTTVGLFLLLYFAYPFTLAHYALAVAPGVIVLLLSGLQVAGRLWPQRARKWSWAPAAIVLLACLLVQPQAVELIRGRRPEVLNAIDRALATVEEPAVVLFTRSPRRSVHAEPVYNYQVSWPDHARVVRAHDLGDRNDRIFLYYATRQPYRHFYRFDGVTAKLHYLGIATALAGISTDATETPR